MNVNEIKKVFFKYNCSMFSVAREDMTTYEEFKKLSDSNQLLIEWKNELLNKNINDLKLDKYIYTFLQID